MPLVKRLRTRGGNIVVVANAELLFVPGGMMSRWNNSISQRVRIATAGFAPSNRRPRWLHYGKPLKESFRTTTAVDAATMQTQAAVSSIAPHAMYVDQGTKSFKASILPPWAYGSPSLFEATFKVPGEGSGAGASWYPVGKVQVSGQAAQHFFEKGLDAGMAASGIILTKGGSTGSKDVDLLAGFTGATATNAGFNFSLGIWRMWRDAAWKSGDALGDVGGRRPPRTKRTRRSGRPSRAYVQQARPRTEQERRERRAEQARTRRAQERDQQKARQANAAQDKAARDRRERFVVSKSAQQRFGPNLQQLIKLANGQWLATVRSRGINRTFVLTNDGWIATR